MPTTTDSKPPRVTRPFDEDTYPRLHFSRQQLDVIALAREMYPKPIRTKLVAERFGCSLRQAYKVLRRLRDKGVFHSQLRWITLPGGSHAAKVEPDGTRRLFSWLNLYLQPMENWGKDPDEIQKRFRPNRYTE
jgi:hypothetical protein